MSSESIKVFVRFRPINEREKTEKTAYSVDIKYLQENKQIKISTTNAIVLPQTYNFDYIFDPSTNQSFFYEVSCKKVVDDVLNGFNGTIFAYGQTGAGKTWSMMGDLKKQESYGLIPRASQAIFSLIENTTEGIEFKLSCSYLEIYNECIQDLLEPSKKNLRVHESPSKGIYVDNLSEEFVGCEADIYELLEIGGNSRVVSFTQMNATSSRSHSVFMITIQQTDPETGSSKTGKLNLVDLAGSEKVGKTGASGQTLEEAKKINLSLSVLGKCINSLVEGKSHIPFRDSKLTRILQESLGGNTKTSLICACSPHPFNIEETISTLKFGQRAKKIECKVKVNAVKSAKELEKLVNQLTSQIQNLKAMNEKLQEENIKLREGGATVSSEKNSEGSDIRMEFTNVMATNDDDPIKFAELKVQFETLQANLASEVSKYQEEVNELKALKEDAEERFKTAEKKLKNTEEVLSQVKEENERVEDSKNKIVKKLEYEKHELELENESLQERLQEAETVKKELDLEVKQLVQKLEFVEKESKFDDSDFIPEGFDGNNLSAEKRQQEIIKHQHESIKKLNEKVQMIQEQYEEEKLTNVEFEKEILKLDKEKGELMEDMKRSEQKLQKILQEKEAIEAECIEVENGLKKTLSDMEAMEDNERRLKSEIEELKRKLSKKDDELNKLKVQGATEQDSNLLEEYQQIIDELKTEIENLEKEKDMETSQIKETLKNEKHIAEVTKKDLEHQLSKKQQLIDEYKNILVTKEEKLRTSNEEIQSLVNEISNLKMQLEIQTTKSSVSQESPIHQQFVDSEKKSLSSDVDEKTFGSYSNVVNMLIDLRKKFQETEHQRRKLEDEANHSRRVINSERAKLRASETKADHREKRIKELEEEIQKMKTQMHIKKKESDTFKSQKTELQKRIDDLENAIETLQQTNAKSRRRRASRIVRPILSGKHPQPTIASPISPFGQNVLRKTNSSLLPSDSEL